MPKCILSGQIKSTFTQEQADSRYIQMTNGAITTLASSLQVSGINNIEFTEEGEDSITASNVSYSNTTSGMTSVNVQNAIDELFQSVSEGKSLIAAAVTDKGVETAATDSFATMAGNIGQISGGGSLKDSYISWIKENGTSFILTNNFTQATMEGDADSYEGLKYFYLEDNNGNEIAWIPWIYETKYSPYAFDSGSYWVETANKEILRIEIGAQSSYEFVIVNESKKLTNPITIYVLPDAPPLRII